MTKLQWVRTETCVGPVYIARAPETCGVAFFNVWRRESGEWVALAKRERDPAAELIQLAGSEVVERTRHLAMAVVQRMVDAGVTFRKGWRPYLGRRAVPFFVAEGFEP